MSYKGDREPVVIVWRLVVQNIGGAVIGGDNGIDAAVVVDIADGHTASCPRLMEDFAGLGRHVRKTLAVVVCQKHRLFVVQLRIVEFDGIEIVTLCDEEI